MRDPDYTMWIEGWRPVPTNLYMRMHFGKRKRTRKRIAEILALYKRLNKVPDAQGKRRVGLHIMLGKWEKRADPDAYWKALLDAMQDAYLLTDDSYEGVELAPIKYGVDWRFPGTRIELWDI
jgi:hypothetical protein